MRSVAGWIVFLLTFLSIYGGMHVYIFFRARAAFRFGLPLGLALALVMAVMISTLIVGRMMERTGLVPLANLVQRAGHIWLGLVFLFFVWAVLVDVFSLLVRVQGLWLAGAPFGPVSAQARFYLPLAIALLMNVYGYFEALNIRVEHQTVTTAKLPPSRDRLRLVQISDVHLGASVGEGRLRRIVDLVKQARPDLLVSTGDLVDSSNGWSRGEAEMWLELKPPLGKYAVTGNHEVYAGLERAIEDTVQAGFRLLRGEAVTVGDAVTLAGVDDPAVQGYSEKASDGEAELLAGLSRERYVVLLKHRPVIDPASVGRFDLQLSGHAHKGQIWPFTYVTRWYYIKDAGWLDLGKNSRLYVSRGVGFWGPPIRVLAPPEITVFDLVRGPEAKEQG